MTESLQITFRHMPASDSLRELASEKLAKLKAHYPDVLDCHVVIDRPLMAHHRKGHPCVTHVEATLGRQHVRLTAEASHDDAYAGLRQAFDNLRRQIETRVEQRRAG